MYLASISEIRPASADGRPSASRIYRLPLAKDAFPTSEWSTLHELFEKSVAKYSKEPLLGWRPFDEAGRVQPYVWMTYEETAERVKEVASGLAGLGLTAGSRVGVYGVNCPEWMLAMQVRVVPPGLLDLGIRCALTASEQLQQQQVQIQRWHTAAVAPGVSNSKQQGQRSCGDRSTCRPLHGRRIVDLGATSASDSTATAAVAPLSTAGAEAVPAHQTGAETLLLYGTPDSKAAACSDISLPHTLA